MAKKLKLRRKKKTPPGMGKMKEQDQMALGRLPARKR